MAERNFGQCPASQDECGFVAPADNLELTGPVALCERGGDCAAPFRLAVGAMAAIEALPDAVAADMAQRLAAGGGAQ